MREIGVAFSGNIINTPSAPPAAPPRWYNKLLKFVVEYGYLCIAGLWFLIIGWQIASSIGTSVKQGSYKYKISQGDNTYYADSYRVQNHCAFMNVLSSGNNNFTGQAALCGNYKIKEQH